MIYRFALGVALLTAPFWAVATADLVFDLHLTYVTLGMLLKLMLPVAILCNVIGSVMAIVSLVKHTPPIVGVLMALVLNMLPLLGIAAMIFWWMFIFKM